MTRPGGQAAHPPLAAFAPLVLTMILWGSAFSVSSLALDHVGHRAAAAMRFGFAAIAMLAVLSLSILGDAIFLAAALCWSVYRADDLRPRIAPPARLGRDEPRGHRVSHGRSDGRIRGLPPQTRSAPSRVSRAILRSMPPA